MKKKSCHRRRTKVVHRSRKNVRRTVKRKSVGKGRRRPTRRYSRVQRGGIDMKLLKSSVNSVCFSPDSKSIAVGSDDRYLRVFNVDSGKEIIRSVMYDDVSSVSFSTDNNNIAIGAKNFLWIFDIDNVRDTMENESLSNYYLLVGRGIGNPGSNVKSVCFSPDGKSIATGSSDTFLRVFGVESRNESFKTKHEGIVNSVCFSPDGKSIAIGLDTNGEGNNTLYVYKPNLLNMGDGDYN